MPPKGKGRRGFMKATRRGAGQEEDPAGGDAAAEAAVEAGDVAGAEKDAEAGEDHPAAFAFLSDGPAAGDTAGARKGKGTGSRLAAPASGSEGSESDGDAGDKQETQGHMHQRHKRVREELRCTRSSAQVACAFCDERSPTTERSTALEQQHARTLRHNGADAPVTRVHKAYDSASHSSVPA